MEIMSIYCRIIIDHRISINILYVLWIEYNKLGVIVINVSDSGIYVIIGDYMHSH